MREGERGSVGEGLLLTDWRVELASWQSCHSIAGVVCSHRTFLKNSDLFGRGRVTPCSRVAAC